MCRTQMASRCPGATLVDNAMLPGWRFTINRLGVATLVPDQDKRVFGLLWTLPAPDELVLDGHEGVADGEYRKETIVVGSHERALIYLATDTTPGHPRPGYLERIVNAATLGQFPAEYIAELTGWRAPE